MTSGPRQPTAVPPEPGDGGRLLLSDGIRRVVVLVLHVAFVVVVGALLVYVSVGDIDGSRPVLLGALAVWVVGYLALGVPALASWHPRGEVAYLAVLVGVVGVLAWEQPSLLFLMFLAYPQVWFFTGSLRAGVLWTLALAVAATLGPFVGLARGTEPLWGPGETLVGLVLSLVMGLWTTRVLEQSAERAELIRELDSTRAELAAAHHEQGVGAERERWAREVHDTLAQGYTSIVVLAQTAVALLPGDPGAAAERVALIEDVARENLAEARAMVAAFAPVALDSATLVEALQRLTERFGRETGLATRLDTAALGHGDSGLSRTEEIVLLRGAQEALANVRRHASASAVVLRLSRVGDVVSVHVEDDGVGFDPAAAAGVGLAGLRDRAEEVGGEVDVASAPGQGTRVTVRVPGAKATVEGASQRPPASEERIETGVESWTR
jgi:signal transduction histidine kinase